MQRLKAVTFFQTVNRNIGGHNLNSIRYPNKTMLIVDRERKQLDLLHNFVKENEEEITLISIVSRQNIWLSAKARAQHANYRLGTPRLSTYQNLNI